MKKIYVSYNADTHQWSHVIEDFDNGFQSLIEFSIVSGQKYTDGKHIHLGYSIMAENEMLQDLQYPPENVKFEQLSSSAIFSNMFTTLPLSEFTVEFWLSNNMKSYYHKFSFKTEKPIQPFPSWIWSNEDHQWVSPKGPPLAGNVKWDEEVKDWIEDDTTSLDIPGPGYVVE